MIEGTTLMGIILGVLVVSIGIYIMYVLMTSKRFKKRMHSMLHMDSNTHKELIKQHRHDQKHHTQKAIAAHTAKHLHKKALKRIQRNPIKKPTTRIRRRVAHR